MRAKHWLALFLVMAMAASLAIIPVTAEENLLAGTGDLKEKTVTFQVKADRENIIYTGGEEVITFTVDVENKNNSDEMHAFSFYLEPDNGLTLAGALKDDGENTDFFFNYPDDGDLLTYYKKFEYTPTPDRRYFAAAKENGTGTGIMGGSKTVLTIMGKVNGPGTYTLTMNTTDKDKAVVAGQVNGTGSNTVSLYFKRAVIPATVKVVAGGVISGTVTDGSAAVPGAVVTLKDSQGAQVGEAVTTGNDGKFTLPAVVNGAYTLDVTAQAGEKTLRGSKSVTVDGSQGNGYAFNGDVTVKEGIPGDVNGDGKINTKDLIRLGQYLAKYAVEINAFGADANGDGKVNTKDLTRLSQYLAHYPVVLGE